MQDEVNQDYSEQNEIERMKKGAVTHVKCRFVDFCFQKGSVVQQQCCCGNFVACVVYIIIILCAMLRCLCDSYV